MPWSPTQAVSHPLAIVSHNDCKPTVVNFVSYAIMDMMIWEGLGDLVNKFRKKVLSLDSLDSITAPSLLPRLEIPFSYLWSPALLSKPKDWGKHIDICGFSFLPSKSDYTPPDALDEFLKAGPKPIYVGFGSIVVEDQAKLTRIVFEAIEQSGQRAIVSKGWGNLGSDEVEVPENVLLIGSVPHDWLFRQVSCVIHHGGAGTTAAGLALGRPTIIIPFFGDQQFWGQIVARSGAGPVPIPHKQLTVDGLSEAIAKALEPSTQEKAMEIAEKMNGESGVRDSVRSFHRHLDLKQLRCAICPTRPAVWHLKHTEVGLSAFAASVLVEMGSVKPDDLVLNRPVEYDTYRDPVGPLSASAQVLFGAISNFVTGLADVPAEMVMDLVTAGRALGHPNEHYDPHSKWHRQRKSREGRASANESRQTSQNRRQPTGRTSNESTNDEVNEETSSSSTDEQETDFSDEALSRARTLQLEKTVTMSGGSLAPKRHNIISEAASQGSRMSKKFINLVIWLPTDLTLSLSKGFHNAPKLYHDPMVKTTPKVIGVRSGFKAAGQELYHGFYDGLTGLVTQPRHAYKENGARGIAKGIGKGLGGAFFKPPAGLWGLAGYPLSGIRRTLLTSLGKSQEGQILLSRISQGHDEMKASSAQDRMEVVRKWAVIEESLKEKSPRRCRSRMSGHEHNMSTTTATA
ncbi:Sterol 3-beta-glucosyltransferase UGT80B1 [Penicillium citrinum]|uniref:Sterol 3-beta-glucosyltransferase UGT80B1 n=1 Tax=Penicillium citrinum TaxID=5077 RepID=A0A9W9NN00_PENCI|nr:Sterol 3-beta-glucosyltransferase UGT80B1 [Penicillium citrinum]KAJ5222942.1 Sterol 3-beta-glucosyltransferase UGT80B1 [Penicillium citrinum]